MLNRDLNFETLTFREVELIDIVELQKISRITFKDTFDWYNTESDMNQYLDENLSIENLTKEFNQEGAKFYFLEYKQETIAFLKLNKGEAQTEKDFKNTLEIERIYILKEFQGKNIGTFILNKAKEIVKNEKLDYLWLAVWEKNEQAIKFYEKHNFKIFGEHDFILGSDVQKDYLMKLK
jgi:ribosomal protein S18 acetylase RimI-like enzyme